MDLLQKELERKRKAIELAKKQAHISISARKNNTDCNVQSGNATAEKRRVYLKASELAKFQHEQEEAERLSANKYAKKRKEGHNDSSNRDEYNTSSGSDKVHDPTLLHPSSTRINHQKEQEMCKRLKTNIKENDGGNQTETASNAAISSPLHSNSQTNSSGHVAIITSDQITTALRELGIPVRLFGETNDEHRLIRLESAKENKRLIMAGMSDIDDFKLGSGHGIRNPFLEKDDDRHQTKQGQPSQSKSSSLKVAGAGANETFEPSSIAAASAVDNDTDVAIKEAYTTEEIDVDTDPHKAIHRFFKWQLKQWEDDLVNRPEAVKRTLQGKNETKTLKQCKDYIRPLFKLCKNRRLEQNMTDHLVRIVKHCQEGEFVKANDAYMDLAIGRAAWPIGVTMVGIHARSGRSKIESNNVAHVMNSELQRKYLTSVKRLITYCQKKRIDVAPSKKVVNI
mmetsp:Transcript_15463/g.29174  ORF Transcript_15463/g.29174 Transcript_15463/m.29174 type:complete len:454 (-) Transcript_15463:1613-2974(-)|eukprot:CAMPEP_0176502962 /NCGR_PEP_ID=MMETSP0200_2-20121128/15065_1 /TAXON_ID=947934 /ORGANISM="Chaetoceros sp., Strain GSL56" /LENGTH=453 /DNA_ID=CAMNT_0017902133 /DNA_START=42 /DNA_END=1403 /DNA_ORIENTATION=+